MKSFFLLFVMCVVFAPSLYGYSSSEDDRPLRIIAIFAHPDDGEFKMGATAAMMADMGHEVKFLSITNGQAGHYNQGGESLASRRRSEAQEAARRLGISSYKVLNFPDGELEPSLEARKEIIREIRKWKADVVIGHRPNDYHPDHRYSGMLVMDAAYMVIVPNIASDVPPLKSNPVFIYMQDSFTRPNPFRHDIVVGVDEAYLNRKMDALDAHESQLYEWLPWTAGIRDQVPENHVERRKWLIQDFLGRRQLSEQQRDGIEYWYGDGASTHFKNAESFEIAEYGRQPGEDEIRRIFPMLLLQR